MNKINVGDWIKIRRRPEFKTSQTEGLEGEVFVSNSLCIWVHPQIGDVLLMPDEAELLLSNNLPLEYFNQSQFRINQEELKE